MMKLALAFCLVPAILGFQPASVSSPRDLSTALSGQRIYDPYMYQDGESRYGGSSRRYKSYELGGRYNSYDSYGGARVPYDSFDAYSGGSGLRTLHADVPGDNTGKSRRLRRFQDVYYGNNRGNGNYGWGRNNNYGSNSYNSYAPTYETSSYAYSAPTVRADGTLASPGLSRYGGYGGYSNNYRNSYRNNYSNNRYGRNLYVDEDRWGNRGNRGLYSQGGIQTPFSRNQRRSNYRRTGGYNGYSGGYGGRRPGGVPIRGGDEETFTVEPNVSSVRVVLQTEGMPLYAKMELLQGFGNGRFLGDVFNDIDEGPFETIIDTPEFDSKLRILNTGSYEYTIYAWLEPYSYMNGRGGYGRRGRYNNSGYNSYGSNRRRW